MGVSKRSENVRAKDVLGCMNQGEGPRFPPHPPGLCPGGEGIAPVWIWRSFSGTSRAWVAVG